MMTAVAAPAIILAFSLVVVERIGRATGRLRLAGLLADSFGEDAPPVQWP